MSYCVKLSGEHLLHYLKKLHQLVSENACIINTCILLRNRCHNNKHFWQLGGETAGI